jgi:hypothetical protein
MISSKEKKNPFSSRAIIRFLWNKRFSTESVNLPEEIHTQPHFACNNKESSVMTSLLTRTILVTFTAVLLTASCKKDDTNPGDLELGTLTAAINGNDFETIDGIAAISTIPGLSGEQFQIAGGDILNGVLTFNIILLVPDGQVIDAATYQYSGVDCMEGTEICGQITYAGVGIAGTSYEATGSMEITFSSIDYQPGGSCSGTFSATLIHVDDQSEIPVTNGKFNLEIAE